MNQTLSGREGDADMRGLHKPQAISRCMTSSGSAGPCLSKGAAGIGGSIQWDAPEGSFPVQTQCKPVFFQDTGGNDGTDGDSACKPSTWGLARSRFSKDGGSVEWEGLLAGRRGS